MSKYIFPIILIVLQLGAAMVYMYHTDTRMAVYWIAAAVLNVCIVMGG